MRPVPRHRGKCLALGLGTALPTTPPTPRQDLRFLEPSECAFDGIGNRKSSRNGGDQTGDNLRETSYTANRLNQYSSRTTPSSADVIGMARGNAVTVKLNGSSVGAPYRKGEYFWKDVTVRPGASPATDRYLSSAIQQWISTEARLGLEVDLRVISFWLSQSSDIDHLMSEIAMPNVPDIGTWRMNTIYGLLWARGRAIRQSALEIRSQFSDLPRVDRLLVIETLVDDREKVSVSSEDWLETAAVHLAAGRMVTLTCEEATRHQLGEALNALITNPIETGYLRAYARLQGIRQTAAIVEADIELVEAVQ